MRMYLPTFRFCPKDVCFVKKLSPSQTYCLVPAGVDTMAQWVLWAAATHLCFIQGCITPFQRRHGSGSRQTCAASNDLDEVHFFVDLMHVLQGLEIVDGFCAALNDTRCSMPCVEVQTLCPIVPRVNGVSAASSSKQFKLKPNICGECISRRIEKSSFVFEHCATLNGSL